MPLENLKHYYMILMILSFNDVLIFQIYFPEDRKNSDDLLKTLGLDYYDPWEIVKKTHGLIKTSVKPLALAMGI